MIISCIKWRTTLFASHQLRKIQCWNYSISISARGRIAKQIKYPVLRRKSFRLETASHTKSTYLSAQFRRLAARKGNKCAIVAVAHTILVVVFDMLKSQQPYRDLGADYFDRQTPSN